MTVTYRWIGAAAVAAALTLGPAIARAEAAPPPDLPACPTAEASPAVTPLLRRIERSLEGKSMVATLTMEIQTKTWSRKLDLKLWSRGRDYALIRVLAGGPRETGMATLKRQRQLWNYLPKAGRVMKLPSSMLGDAWMGSDFTNDDLVRGSSIVDDSWRGRCQGHTYASPTRARHRAVGFQSRVDVFGCVDSLHA